MAKNNNKEAYERENREFFLLVLFFIAHLCQKRPPLLCQKRCIEYGKGGPDYVNKKQKKRLISIAYQLLAGSMAFLELLKVSYTSTLSPHTLVASALIH